MDNLIEFYIDEKLKDDLNFFSKLAKGDIIFTKANNPEYYFSPLIGIFKEKCTDIYSREGSSNRYVSALFEESALLLHPNYNDYKRGLNKEVILKYTESPKKLSKFLKKSKIDVVGREKIKNFTEDNFTKTFSYPIKEIIRIEPNDYKILNSLIQ